MLTRLTLPVFILISTIANAQINFELHGEIKGAGNKWVVLTHDVTKSKIDSIQAVDGKFKFSRYGPNADLIIITVKGIKGRIPVFTDNGIINITGDTARLSNATISGSKEHLLYKKVNELELQASITPAEINSFKTANAQNDTATINKIRREVEKRNASSREQMMVLLNANPDSHVWSHFLASIRNFGNNSKFIAQIYEMYKATSDKVKQDSNSKLFLERYNAALSKTKP